MSVAADASRRARQSVGRVVEAALDRVFDEPLDVPTAAEARRQLEEHPRQSWGPAGIAAVDWAVARAARSGAFGRLVRRAASRSGARLAGRAVLPLSVALDVGLAARQGVHELQVLASYLIARFRDAGLSVEPDLVRRAAIALYLDPSGPPDVSRSAADLAASVARRWASRAVPGVGLGHKRETRRRVRAFERLDIHRLVDDWSRGPRQPSNTAHA